MNEANQVSLSPYGRLGRPGEVLGEQLGGAEPKLRPGELQRLVTLARLEATDKDEFVRGQAIDFLGRFKARQGLTAVLNCRFDGSWYVRTSAYWAIARIAKGRALQRYLEPGKIDNHQVVRKATWTGLIDSFGVALRPDVVRALEKERAWHPRVALLYGLALWGDEVALARLRRMQQNPRRKLGSIADEYLAAVERKAMAR
jgi:HEAT repeat protein